MSGLYFDYIKEVLQAAAQETAANFSCKPPPCLNSQQTPGTAIICIYDFYLADRHVRKSRVEMQTQADIQHVFNYINKVSVSS